MQAASSAVDQEFSLPLGGLQRLAGGCCHRAALRNTNLWLEGSPQGNRCAPQEHAVTLESAVTGVSLNSRDPSKGIVSFALGLPVQVDLQSGAVTQLPAVPGALATSRHMLLNLLPYMSAAFHLLAARAINMAACCTA